MADSCISIETPKKPRRILHFTNGETLEEYSTDEEEEAEERTVNVVVDPAMLPWSKWSIHYITLFLRGSLKVIDFCGEKLAWALGITSPKYQWAIDEHERWKAEQKEDEELARAEEEAMRQWESLGRVNAAFTSGDTKKSSLPSASQSHPSVTKEPSPVTGTTVDATNSTNGDKFSNPAASDMNLHEAKPAQVTGVDKVVLVDPDTLEGSTNVTSASANSRVAADTPVEVSSELPNLLNEDPGVVTDDRHPGASSEVDSLKDSIKTQESIVKPHHHTPLSLGNITMISLLNEASYREHVEQAANYNTKLSIERKSRLPFIDPQTGVAQRPSYMRIRRIHRMPGAEHGQVYSYPARRWKRKKQIHEPESEVEQAELAPENSDAAGAEMHQIVAVENLAAKYADGIEEAIAAEENIDRQWYGEEDVLDDIPDAGEVDNDSDVSDYEDTLRGYKRKRKAASKSKRSKQTSSATTSAASNQPPLLIPGGDDVAERNFVCSVCNNKYKTKSGLVYHATHVHNTYPEGDLAEPPEITSSCIPAVVPSNVGPAPPNLHRASALNGSHKGTPSPSSTGGSCASGGKNRESAGKRHVTQGAMATAGRLCDFCLGDESMNKRTGEKEEMVSCADCGRAGHPSCLQFTETMRKSVKKYGWQCIECKSCWLCGTQDNDDQLLFCDDCDRGYHLYCLTPPLSEPPEGNWSCHLCMREYHGGTEHGVPPTAQTTATTTSTTTSTTTPLSTTSTTTAIPCEQQPPAVFNAEWPPKSTDDSSLPPREDPSASGASPAQLAPQEALTSAEPVVVQAISSEAENVSSTQYSAAADSSRAGPPDLQPQVYPSSAAQHSVSAADTPPYSGPPHLRPAADQSPGSSSLGAPTQQHITAGSAQAPHGIPQAQFAGPMNGVPSQNKTPVPDEYRGWPPTQHHVHSQPPFALTANQNTAMLSSTSNQGASQNAPTNQPPAQPPMGANQMAQYGMMTANGMGPHPGFGGQQPMGGYPVSQSIMPGQMAQQPPPGYERTPSGYMVPSPARPGQQPTPAAYSGHYTQERPVGPGQPYPSGQYPS